VTCRRHSTRRDHAMNCHVLTRRFNCLSSRHRSSSHCNCGRRTEQTWVHFTTVCVIDEVVDQWLWVAYPAAECTSEGRIKVILTFFNVSNAFAGTTVTQLMWGRTLCIRLEARNLRTQCQKLWIWSVQVCSSYIWWK